jgi:hypothetical protein
MPDMSDRATGDYYPVAFFFSRGFPSQRGCPHPHGCGNFSPTLAQAQSAGILESWNNGMMGLPRHSDEFPNIPLLQYSSAASRLARVLLWERIRFSTSKV